MIWLALIPVAALTAWLWRHAGQPEAQAAGVHAVIQGLSAPSRADSGEGASITLAAQSNGEQVVLIPIVHRINDEYVVDAFEYPDGSIIGAGTVRRVLAEPNGGDDAA